MTKPAQAAPAAEQDTVPTGTESGVSAAAESVVSSAPAPPGPDTPVELNLAIGALKALAVTALVVLPIAWWLAGTTGLIGAAVAAAVVGGMYAMSGAMLSWAAKLGPSALLAAALGGFAMRLMIYALLLVLLEPLESIHGESLAISAAVFLVVTLIWEVRIVSRTPQLFWINAQAAKPHAASATKTYHQ